MSKGIIGVFASLIFAVAVLGGIFWDMHRSRHKMVLESKHLDTLIDQQRDSNRDILYYNTN